MAIPFTFDIETIPDQTPLALETIVENVTAPGQYKKPESIEKWLNENAATVGAEEYHKTGLKGISGEICSVAWALGDGDIKSLIRLPGDTEKELLESFYSDVFTEAERMADGWPRLQWIGHNIIEFDMRFLVQRSWIQGVQPSFTVPVDAKHGGDWVYDTMKAWAGWKGYVSQNALARALGLEGKTDLTGADVWDAYQKGDYELIESYNKSDVRTVREIYKRLTYAS